MNFTHRPLCTEAAPKHYVTSVWAGAGLVLLPAAGPLGLLSVVHRVVLRCWWLLWCDTVWPLHTRGSDDSVEISAGKEGYLEL